MRYLYCVLADEDSGEARVRRDDLVGCIFIYRTCREPLVMRASEFLLQLATWAVMRKRESEKAS